MKTILMIDDKVKIEVFSTTDSQDAFNTIALILGESCARRIFVEANSIDLVECSNYQSK